MLFNAQYEYGDVEASASGSFSDEGEISARAFSWDVVQYQPSGESEPLMPIAIVFVLHNHNIHCKHIRDFKVAVIHRKFVGFLQSKVKVSELRKPGHTDAGFKPDVLRVILEVEVEVLLLLNGCRGVVRPFNLGLTVIFQSPEESISFAMAFIWNNRTSKSISQFDRQRTPFQFIASSWMTTKG